MDINKLTQEQLLAAEGYFTLATMIGKCLQSAVYILDHPDYRPRVLVYNGEIPEQGSPASEDQENEDPVMVPTESVYSGRIRSGELSIESQIEQAICLFDPRIRDLVGDLPLYDMFHFATSLVDYEPQGSKEDLTPTNKRKAAIAWVITKRAYAIFHMEEALHFMNIPDVLIGDIVLNAPLPSRKMDDTDREFIARACALCAEIIDNDVPLQDLIDAAIKELEEEPVFNDVGKLAPLGSIPNGDVLAFLNRVVSNGLRLRGSKANRHEEITGLRKGNTVRFTRTNKENGNTYTVEIAQADKYLSKTSKTFKKLLLFSLQKMAAQNEPLEVGFSLQELVDLGMYSTTSNAIRGIREFFAQQKQTMLSGTLKKGRKTIREDGGILFYHYHIENGYVKLSVNENFNLDFITNFYTVFPRFAYSLSNNAFSLVRYIFFIARQKTESIKDNGTFNISLEAVRDNIGLPAPADVKNRKYKQYIIDPIESAIEEIETALQTVPEAKDCCFTITPIIPDANNINKWLEGYLTIGLKGDFAERFVKIATDAEAAREKRARAKIAAMAKLEAQKELASKQ